MPEGHTLHRLARDLTDAFAARAVRVSSPQGRFADEAALLDASTVESAEAWGKHLFVTFTGERVVHVHLGLYGSFAITAGVESVPAPVGQVRLRLVAADDERATYADLRGPTACTLMRPAEQGAIVDRLGPDPLRPDADPERMVERVRRSRAPIGTLLMDQSVLAGVGNVYRAEVLFRHRVHPLRPGTAVRRRTLEAMWDDLVGLMEEGVRTGRIDTVRPEHTPEAMGRPPRQDDHGGEVYVYRRTGQPCFVCERPVRTDVLATRNVFWCARCQPAYRPRAVQ